MYLNNFGPEHQSRRFKYLRIASRKNAKDGRRTCTWIPTSCKESSHESGSTQKDVQVSYGPKKSKLPTPGNEGAGILPGTCKQWRAHPWQSILPSRVSLQLKSVSWFSKSRRKLFKGLKLFFVLGAKLSLSEIASKRPKQSVLRRRVQPIHYSTFILTCILISLSNGMPIAFYYSSRPKPIEYSTRFPLYYTNDHPVWSKDYKWFANVWISPLTPKKWSPIILKRIVEAFCSRT
jgi:hypothetical protein